MIIDDDAVMMLKSIETIMFPEEEMHRGRKRESI